MSRETAKHITLKMDDFAQNVAIVHDRSRPGAPVKVSVVVVTYNSTPLLFECLDSLMSQSFADHEIVLVDNGGSDSVQGQLKTYPLRHIRMKHNVGCSAGKSVGALFARGDIVCFIDDDAVADRQFVAEHYLAYELHRVIGVRGKVLLRNPSAVYNALVTHYDLGDDVIPAYIDTETNASFLRSAYLECGGFSSSVLRGDTEGVELSYRLAKMAGDPAALIYYPKAVVYHDYATSLGKVVKKTYSQTTARVALRETMPGLDSFIMSYHLPSRASSVPTGVGGRMGVHILKRSMHVLRRLTWYWHRARQKLHRWRSGA